MDWVYDNLLGWLRSIYGLQGLHLDQEVFTNAQPSVNHPDRLTHHWTVLGTQIWERAELSLHTQGPIEREWVNIREFQRDILTWVKVWQDCHYHPPGARYPVAMSSLINLLINTLHSLTGAVEVCVLDPNDNLIHVWVRLKTYPNSYCALISIPKFTSED